MKTRLFRLFPVMILVVCIATGCQVADATTTTASGTHTNLTLTLEEAQGIALKHAGFTADQVTALRTEYEIEHGTPQYDVEFRHGFWEYDYKIHADTGEVLSFSKDD